MFSFPLEKYKFYIATKITGEPYKVIATSSYAGKTVRGVAKCARDDTFDMEKGKKLAAARCNLKIAEKRARRARRELGQALSDMVDANTRATEMENYYNDSEAAKKKAINDLAELLFNM
jgi:hypothetical protein